MLGVLRNVFFSGKMSPNFNLKGAAPTFQPEKTTSFSGKSVERLDQMVDGSPTIYP